MVAPLARISTLPGHAADRFFRRSELRLLIIGFLILLGLYITQHYSFLLFHVLVEMFSVIVACGIFMFVWSTRKMLKNSSLAFLGIAYLFIGGVDLLHTLSYKGMGVLPGDTADTATQLWIAARYLESVSLAAAPLFLQHRVKFPLVISAFGLAFALIVATVFFWPIFPTCYVEGSGLTLFKKASEYIIIGILLVALALLIRQRERYERLVLHLLGASVVFTMASELLFTFYISVYGISNLIGHYLKLISFYLIYKAILEIGLQRPFKLMFRELKQSEENLRKGEKRFRELAESLPTGICEIGPDGMLSYINAAGLEIFGFSRRDFNGGINIFDVIPPERHEKAARRLAQVTQGVRVESTEYQIIRKDGSEAFVIVNSVPIQKEGQLTHTQTSIVDITELKRLQNKLQQAKQMEAVSTLAGGIAHEINNALTALIGRTDLLKLKAEKDRLEPGEMDQIIKGSDRIAELIRKLLAYARGGRYQIKPLDMTAFVRQSIAQTREWLDPKVRMHLSIASNLNSFRIEADPTQLQMVLTAILGNASEAIETGGRIDIRVEEKQIDDRASRDTAGLNPGSYICVVIKDNGKGMEAHILDRIFEPFFSTKFTGRGLGMAAVYGIVKNHGGWIGVSSALGLGTTVRIYFPKLESKDLPPP